MISNGELFDQVRASLWYRLGRHQLTCTQAQTNTAVTALAHATNSTELTAALYIYWLLREGSKEALPDAFLAALEGHKDVRPAQ